MYDCHGGSKAEVPNHDYMGIKGSLYLEQDNKIPS